MRFRHLLAGLGCLAVAACAEDVTRPVPAPSIPSVDPETVPRSPLLELTIAGLNTGSPTSSARMLPGFTPQAPVRVRRTLPGERTVPWELLRTPTGEVLDYPANGAWRVLGRRVAAYRQQLLERGDFAALNAPMRSGKAQASAAAVGGIKKIPTILFRFADHGTAEAFAPSEYASKLFGDPAPAGRPYSIKTFFSQLSNGLLTLDGDVIGWQTLAGNEATYTGGTDPSCNDAFGGHNCNGLNSAAAITAMRTALTQSLTAADPATNFGLYDNDGPDGTPNSGDDDGFVDLMLFIHSEADGACGTDHLWSHKSGIPGAFTTNDARTSAPGQFIRVSTYTVQSGLGGSTSCNAGQIMAVGTTAHETGHAFGLPDLYDTQGSTEGIGQWGLMGSGNYTSSFSPSRMEAWSLNQMGWVTLRAITTDGTYSFGAAPTSDSAFVIRVQGTNSRKEYYFVENRQGVQADTAMIAYHCLVAESYAPPGPPLSFPSTCHGGLAIWHADSAKITGSPNSVNFGSIHGLSLVQADAFGDLESGLNRGDAGDLFPGFGLNTPNNEYSLHSSPAAVTNASANTSVGFKIDQITQVVPDGEMSFRVSFGRPLAKLASTGGYDGTIQLDHVTTANFTVGTAPTGYRYVSTTYRVRNATLAGNAYVDARKNLTFVGVVTPTSLNQSAISRLWRADDSPAPGSAAGLFPTGAAIFDGVSAAKGNAPDILQSYHEYELNTIGSIAGVTSILPYGFVVSNPGRPNDRNLPASPSVSTYAGMVTFAFKVPLAANPLDDPTTITARFLAVDDQETTITQSPEEYDAASITAINNRVTALGATKRSLITTSTLTNVEKMCVRSAGTSASPTQTFGAC